MWTPEEPKDLSPRDLRKWKKQWGSAEGKVDPKAQETINKDLGSGKYPGGTGSNADAEWASDIKSGDKDAIRQWEAGKNWTTPHASAGGSTADRVMGMMKQGYAQESKGGRGVASQAYDPKDPFFEGVSREEYEDEMREQEDTMMDDPEYREGRLELNDALSELGAMAPKQKLRAAESGGKVSGYKGGGAPSQGGVEYEGERMSDEEFKKQDAANSAKIGNTGGLKKKLQKAKYRSSQAE